MINIAENKIKSNENDFFLTYQDILGKDNLYNYIAIKSNGEKNPEIKILNEEDLNSNNFVENNLKNENNYLSWRTDFKNNFRIEELNPIFNSKKDENIDLINLNSKPLYPLQNKKPIELFFISQENNPTIVNDINNINSNDFNTSNPFNPFINNNSGEFICDNNKEKEVDFTFINNIPNNEN